MKINKLRKILYIAGLCVGSGLLLLQTAHGVQTLASSQLRLAIPGFLGIALFLAILANGMQMWVWYLLARVFPVHITGSQVLQGYVISFLPRYIPGTVWGYLSRSEWMHREHQIPHQITNSMSVLEVIAVVIANLVALTLTSAINIDKGLYSFSLFFGILIIFGGWLIVRIIPRIKPMNTLLSRVMNFNYISNISFRQWMSAIFILVFQWFIYGAITWLISRALYPAYIPTSINDILIFTSIYCAAWLAGFFLFIIPAGVGFRELALSSLLIFFLGITFDQANIISVLSRLLIIMAESIWVIVGLLAKRADVRRKIKLS